MPYGTLLAYEVKHSWSLNLTNTDLFQIDTTVVGEIGYMLLYTCTDGGGRISQKQSSDTYTNLRLDANKVLSGKLNSSNNVTFNVIIEAEMIQKIFNIWTSPKFYMNSGTYDIKAWLQDKGPFDYGTVNADDGNNHFSIYGQQLILIKEKLNTF